VPLDDAAAVADASTAFSRAGTVRAVRPRAPAPSFAFVERLFAGATGLSRLDMPYQTCGTRSDARSRWRGSSTGYRQQGAPRRGTAPDLGLVAVLLALLHDTASWRTTTEASLCGPELAAAHESRSAAFAADYLRSTASPRMRNSLR